MKLPTWAPFRLQLWRQERERQTAKAVCEADIRAAQEQKKSRDEIDQLCFIEDCTLKACDDDIEVLVTRRLLATAHRLFLPIPVDGPIAWDRAIHTRERFLTRQAMTELRAAIANE